MIEPYTSRSAEELTAIEQSARDWGRTMRAFFVGATEAGFTDGDAMRMVCALIRSQGSNS